MYVCKSYIYKYLIMKFAHNKSQDPSKISNFSKIIKDYKISIYKRFNCTSFNSCGVLVYLNEKNTRKMGLKYSKFLSHTKFKRSANSNNSNNSNNSPPIKKIFNDDFKFIDGRRYHNVENIHYFLPNDDQEIDRLQLQHYMMRYIWRSNFSSPVRDLLNEGGVHVLDVGFVWSSYMDFRNGI
ncbi:hypothetical protein C2G38_2280735 [Gigaspora rosea]|uniref:Uncharacterized protein n=1 Tax=Gigaspora rosea TaxID=44941 RepID=A0A397U5A8_9GLOM|nr:hypothetical protein C2G38_2280735 [Gigaspora rosea]